MMDKIIKSLNDLNWIKKKLKGHISNYLKDLINIPRNLKLKLKAHKSIVTTQIQHEDRHNVI